VCVYTCIHVCTYMCICTCIYVCVLSYRKTYDELRSLHKHTIYIPKHTYTYTRVNIIYTHINTRVYTHKYTCIYIHTHKYICIYIHIYIYTRACICAYMYMCVPYVQIHVYMCVYIHVLYWGFFSSSRRFPACMQMWIRLFVNLIIIYMSTVDNI